MTAVSEREHFSSGSVRDSQIGKGRYDLLPPRAIREVAIRFEEGAKNYGDRNWEKGQDLGRLMSSAIRHAFQVMQGCTDENHAAAAAWNILAFMETRALIREGKLPPALDNLPK